MDKRYRVKVEIMEIDGNDLILAGAASEQVYSTVEIVTRVGTIDEFGRRELAPMAYSAWHILQDLTDNGPKH